MKPTRYLVCSFFELSASVEFRQDNCKSRNVEFGMDVNRNASAIIAYSAIAVLVQNNIYLGAIACKCFIHCVV